MGPRHIFMQRSRFFWVRKTSLLHINDLIEQEIISTKNAPNISCVKSSPYFPQITILSVDPPARCYQSSTVVSKKSSFKSLVNTFGTVTCTKPYRAAEDVFKDFYTLTEPYEALEGLVTFLFLNQALGGSKVVFWALLHSD